MKLERYMFNPILTPDIKIDWEAGGIFNPGVVKRGKKIIMLYRALSAPIQKMNKEYIRVSSIGYAESKDGIHFENKRFFFGPEYHYEAFACEDPRITYFKGKYFIFYTAVASWPPTPNTVKVALATTEDFEDYKKHGLITPFNAKAMALFPEKIKDKIAVIFTYYPDIPPSKVCIAYFDSLKELMNPSQDFWKDWLKYPEFEENVIWEAIPPQKYAEVGAPPILTDEGWLLIYPDITPDNIFRIGAILLDLEDPTKIIARTKEPLLEPMTDYEMIGNVSGVAFPEGVVEIDGKLYIYYGSADKYISLAFVDKDKLVNYLIRECRL